ncbi:MAG: nitrogen fixation protein FixH, partial [Gammaproteobacteria bacterium]|nr:nitrogen fixation protein FixH [Gammaproteobacteria bacterium]
MNSSSVPPTPRPAWRNPWILGGGFIIVVVLSANAAMIYLAIDSNPGLVVEDYYDKGQDYEKTVLTRQALSQQLSLRIDAPREIQLGEATTFQLTGVDNTDQPIQIDAVTLHAYR